MKTFDLLWYLIWTSRAFNVESWAMMMTVLAAVLPHLSKVIL